MWAIYGAREGLVKTMLTDWDFVNVRDFKYLNDLWKEKESADSTKNAYRSNRNIRAPLIDSLDILIGQMPLDEQQSKFPKLCNLIQ